jgi:hypothetical protein
MFGWSKLLSSENEWGALVERRASPPSIQLCAGRAGTPLAPQANYGFAGNLAGCN